MKIGINWTSPRHVGIARSLLESGRASFCEVLIDNFLHLCPDAIKAAFPGWPLAFHIMNSRFLRRAPDELRGLAARLRLFARELRPLYVSDHLAVFTEEGRQLPFPQELDYGDYERTRESVESWQELMGTPLLFENYPSILDAGRAQPQFLDKLLSETGAGLLFDFSNAVVARANCGVPLEAWTPLIGRARHFHAAGYRLAGTSPDFVVDSHDCELSAETLGFLRRAAPAASEEESTLIVERDAEVEEKSWSRDLAAVSGALA